MNFDTACWRTIYGRADVVSSKKYLSQQQTAINLFPIFASCANSSASCSSIELNILLDEKFCFVKYWKRDARKVFEALVHNSIMLIKFMCAQHEHSTHTHTLLEQITSSDGKQNQARCYSINLASAECLIWRSSSGLIKRASLNVTLCKQIHSLRHSSGFHQKILFKKGLSETKFGFARERKHVCNSN